MRFHKKILAGYCIILFFLLITVFSFTKFAVKEISVFVLKNQANALIQQAQNCPSIPVFIQSLLQKQNTFFFRIALLDTLGTTIYDSHASISEENNKSKDLESKRVHPEVRQSLQQKWGYNEEYSDLLKQDLVYVAKSFIYNDQTFILRFAFSLDFLKSITRWFEIGFICLGTVMLLFFTAINSYFTYYQTAPIRNIIKLIQTKNQKGQIDLPYIPLRSQISNDDFDRLAFVLNQLSAKIREQFDHLIQSKNEKEAILEALTEGIVSVDEDKKIAYANSSALSIFGKLRYEVVEQTFEILKEKECASLVHECIKKQSVFSEVLYKQAGYSARFFHLSAIPLPQKEGAVLIMNDQTDHYKIIQLHKDFIANAAHELRTPMTIIQGFTETLLQSSDFTKEKIHMILEKILKHTHRVNYLITNLLSLSHLENNKLIRKQECDLYSIAQNCTQILLQTHSDACITVQKENTQLVSIQGDPQLIEMALINLIENGIKYSPPPAKIKILMGKDPIQKCIWVTIEDKGIGIPEEDISHVFERFYRVEKTRSRTKGGSGLGLSIVQMAVTKHGGTIDVKSVPGQGTIFTLQFFY